SPAFLGIGRRLAPAVVSVFSAGCGTSSALRASTDHRLVERPRDTTFLLGWDFRDCLFQLLDPPGILRAPGFARLLPSARQVARGRGGFTARLPASPVGRYFLNGVGGDRLSRVCRPGLAPLVPRPGGARPPR